MKRLLNTLYITSPETYLCKEGNTVKVEVEHETRLKVPIHNLSSVVCFGPVTLSPPLMELCSNHNVSMAFFNEWGKFQARVHGRVSGNVLLRRKQYRSADLEEFCIQFTRSILAAKLMNSRTVLLRAIRDRPEAQGNTILNHAQQKLAVIIKELPDTRNLETLRGKEGDAAKIYFGAFDHLITRNKDTFYFKERNRRPPLDSMNALLSFIYTLLTHDVVSALEGVGLDPAVGFLHKDRPGRPSLALDLVEEFRSCLADRIALSLVNLQQIGAKGFQKMESGAVLMDDDTRKTVLVAWQNRKQEEITHPFLGEKLSVGLLFHVQAQLLARHLRGDLEIYPPFFWK
ncbi:type I-C CRISPR-associated endonuclease Cas1 [candidate division KSB1 bacterium]|nr:type I-C CRISPR-associated endonuclease Cas1 [candidate division KSB1 bacterium]NIS27865.1 type I-C CRISPR-associated endonuclease Cas1 [candidate division KSB1 bacterium]NIT74748.1 type I-C CRISPR-associated endonuclease Cas1 [candidate division KSB1 bacterium]NIU28530.1 type I-C CRISPR-associated endonuclease Cas1 [candidate division KSB1 bacterium]NIU94333.1 type I-C CRISPR-associated endonuclease Cas1 [candidate division KSB1 bacterium]